ncbi:hypothetical protein [Actinomadura litoris]|nr:hypothetical protein [Actinomadura litoris]
MLLDAQDRAAQVGAFQADQFGPPRAGVAQRDDEDELVIAP